MRSNQGPRTISLIAATVLLAGVGLLGAGAAPEAIAHGVDFELDDLGDFKAPVHVSEAQGADSLLFVVEQRGTIAVLDDGVEQSTRFLDIRDQVRHSGEQGLLSVAFDPDYDTNRIFYVYYTTNGGDERIDQFKRKQSDPLRASLGSRNKVIKIQHDQADNHNGGQLQFGPDDYLYAGIGDGGPQQDPENDAQDPDSLLGKLLRIDPHAGGGYSVPGDNPYVGGPGADELFAIGLRNPWRFSFDSATGALTIGDVGGTDWEEVDYVAGGGLGANFGWNDYEGTHETSFGIGPNASPHTPPIAEFSHDDPDQFCAIAGGYVVHDPGLPSLAGEYLFSDLCANDLQTIQIPSGAPGTDLGLNAGSPVSFGEGLDGQIYVVDHGGDVFALETAA